MHDITAIFLVLLQKKSLEGRSVYDIICLLGANSAECKNSAISGSKVGKLTWTTWNITRNKHTYVTTFILNITWPIVNITWPILITWLIVYTTWLNIRLSHLQNLHQVTDNDPKILQHRVQDQEILKNVTETWNESSSNTTMDGWLLDILKPRANVYMLWERKGEGKWWARGSGREVK